MNKETITLIRWFATIIGMTSAIVGFLIPEWANQTNHICWFSVFTLGASYPEKK